MVVVKGHGPIRSLGDIPMSSLALIQNLLRSKTFFGLVVLVVGMVFKGVDPNALTDEIYKTLLLLTDGVGAVLVLWGRMTAKEPLIDIKPAPAPAPLGLVKPKAPDPAATPFG